MIFDNARYLSILIKRVYFVLLLTIAAVLILAGFFATKWYQASKLDNVYVVFPDNTFVAHRTAGSLLRSDYEIEAFAKLFLDMTYFNLLSWLAFSLVIIFNHSNRLFPLSLMCILTSIILIFIVFVFPRYKL